MEGYKKGKITEIYKITCVHDNKECIYAYYIDSLGWMSKNECIKLARRGKLDVVICKSCLGNLYLRSRPDQRVGNNFSPEKNIPVIQLVVQHNTDWPKMRKGNHLRLIGTLFRWYTGHHHTRVLMLVDKVFYE